MNRKNRTKPLYPECEKLHAASELSNKIGQFVDWLQEKGIEFSKRHEHTDECYEDGDKHPVCGYNEDQLQPVMQNTESLLAEYFNIDLKKVEQERQQILAEMQAANKQK